MKTAILFISALLLMAARGFTQERKPTSVAELATYRGPDRESILYAGAKTEGKVTWYTSLAGASYKEIAKAFSARYAGVQVEPFRAPGADLVVRLEEEAKAGRKIADAIETTEGSLIFLRDEKLIRPYDSPHLDKYPEDGKERAKKGLVYWALARESYVGFAYNTKLLPKEAVPKDFSGLLHPALEGKMGISIGQTSDKVIGAMIKTRGEEFVKSLKVQNIKLFSIGAPALVHTIESGEIIASPAIFQTHTLLAASKGAPVEWIPMDLVPTNVGSAAIAADPPHPHAALLMADFLLSPAGQGVLAKFYYGSATKAQPFKKWRPEHGLTTEQYEKKLSHWDDLLNFIAHR
jgi:iron(III) transport system substrate-binding protein